MPMRRLLHAALITLRFLLGPMLILDALDGRTGIWFGVGLVVALLSDVFDGVVARRLGVATPRLREADSWVDGWFCSCVVVCLFLARRHAVAAFWPWMLAWFATDLLALSFD